jgi:hypothetical protein
VSRKIILFLLLSAVVGIMLFALLYGMLDVHDTKPFFSDPESAVVVASALLVFCLRVMTFEFPLLSFASLVQLFIVPTIVSTERWVSADSAPEPALSPPLSCLSLRI